MSAAQIVLGITGGIAAYKAGDIVRGLRREGAEVTVAMTPAAARFITPLTMATLSGRRVITSSFDLEVDETGEADIEHVGLAHRCDLLLVAPATANILGKMAAGVADDFLSTFHLAVRCPVLVAPAMNPAMWNHPAVQANVERLRERGVELIEPEFGPLASRSEGEGVGRLAAPERIVQRSMALLREGAAGRGLSRDDLPLSGRKVLVTAGPTRESFDPVRFISSPSTGKMGFALARAARDLGAEVVLVTGPTHLPDPPGVTTLRVTSAEEMRDAVISHLNGCRVVVKAAAVADFRPATRSEKKTKKEDTPPRIDLEPTPDILAEVASAQDDEDRFVIGFAAETDDLIRNARAKLEAKRLDLIVANDIGDPGIGFGSDLNEVVVIGKDGREERWPRMSKTELAERLMRLVAGRIA